jgi:hypothetical protein
LKKTLYILTKAPGQEGPSLLPSLPASSEGVSVVLIQDGVRYQALPFPRVFTLSDGPPVQTERSPFPSVSYEGLLRMIFDADSVAVL